MGKKLRKNKHDPPKLNIVFIIVGKRQDMALLFLVYGSNVAFFILTISDIIYGSSQLSLLVQEGKR